ncbi:MAG: hypothetical protein P8P98_06875 [Emcibacteraceae bacterium]|nr:hypothetical protein [Emcibacteraceae bacterium]
MKKIFLLMLLLPFTVLADTAAGIKAYDEGNFERAFVQFETASRAGEVEASYRLALMYQAGEFIEKNDFSALINFEKAGHLGHVDAMREAIRYHLNGWGTIPNRALAAIWIKLSADANPEKYLKQFNRFYAKLTTFERLEYEERLESKRY